MDIEFGRNFSLNEVTEGQPKVVIGQDVAKKLFNNKPEAALDQIITVGSNKYRVVGILVSKGASMNNSNDRSVLRHSFV